LSLLQPANFHHHSPSLHLAFICAHSPKHGKSNGKWRTIEVRGPSFHECEIIAMQEFLDMGVPESWKLSFLGHAV
jgi:hypothetical protein